MTLLKAESHKQWPLNILNLTEHGHKEIGSQVSTVDVAAPVLSSVVMASVAMLLFWSVMRLSMSMLQLVTAMGCVIATCATDTQQLR
jgi:hypothetical protein